MTVNLTTWDHATAETRGLFAVFEGSESPPLHHLGVEGARSVSSAAARFLQGPPHEVARVRDLVIERDGCTVPARIYHPAPGTALPLIVYVHGGGWVTGDLDVVDGPCRRLAVGTNSVVVSLDYRRSPETRGPGAVDDVSAAARWCAEHRADLGASATGLTLMGDSAGAHLIACALVRDQLPEVTSAVLLYPPIAPHAGERLGSYADFAGSPILSADTMDWFWSQHLDGGATAVDLTDLGEVSSFPRTLMVSAGIDVLRDEGLDFVSRLRTAGAEVEVLDYPCLAHGFFWMDRFIPEALAVVSAVGEFLDRRSTGT